jgi:glycosyltransferase 2 family protein
MTEAVIKKESQTMKVLKLLLKIAVTILCFWYISRKIDFTKAKDAVLQADWWWLFLSVVAFAFSKFLASFRLNIYFRNIGINLPQKQNLKLYWLGMFYNLFLPGAISGDAYKVVLLTRKYDVGYKKITAAVLLDRFSGLLALGLILSVYGVIVLDNKLYDVILISGSVLAVVALYLVVKYLFKDFLPGFWPTFLWGIAVQVFQVVCVYCILMGLHLPLQSEWIFIFLVAAVITVIPISLGGGLGTRELVFVEGARYFGLDMHVAPIISILFYLSNALSSVWGVYFIYHDPLKDESRT